MVDLGIAKCMFPTVGNVIYAAICMLVWPIEAIQKGFSPSYVWDRLKPRCSTNGKNQGTIWYWPYFFEVISGVCSLVLAIQLTAGYKSSVSAVADAKMLLETPGVLKNATEGWWHVDGEGANIRETDRDPANPFAHLSAQGHYGKNGGHTFYMPREAGYTLLFDRDLLSGRVQGFGTATASVTQAEIDKVMTSFNGTVPTMQNRQILPADFVTISQGCMCIGVLPCNSILGIGCEGSASQSYHRSCQLPQCLVRPYRFGYADINPGITDVASVRLSDCRRQSLCIVGLCLGRMLAMFFCRKQLRRPGSGIYNGSFVVVLCYILHNYIKNEIIGHLVAPKPHLVRLAKGWANTGQTQSPCVNCVYAFPYGAMEYLGGFESSWYGAQSLCIIIGVTSLLTNFFGGEAYCTDMSTYAYGKKNINRYRERVRIANL